MDINTKQKKDTSKSHFRDIINDDIAIDKRHISKSKSAETFASEVDPLYFRLRRLNVVQALSHCNLRGSMDSSREDSKVRFENTASVKFFQEPRMSISKDFMRPPRSPDIPATDSILAKKRIPGFSSCVDKPADVANIDVVDTCSDCTSVPCSSIQEPTQDMKMNTSEGRTGLGCCQDTVYGRDCSAVGSEVDPPFDDKQFLQCVPEPHEKPAERSQKRSLSLRSFICCGRWRSKRKPDQYDDNAASEAVRNKRDDDAASGTDNSSTITSTCSSLKPSPDVAKVKYFQYRRKSSMNGRSKLLRMVDSLK